MVKTSYKIPAFTEPHYEPETQIRCLKQFRELCHRHDIPTKNTRLGRYQNYLVAKAAGDENGFRHFQSANSYPFDKESDLWLYVIREIHELMWILKGAEKSEPLGLREPLKKLVGGADFAALDRDSSSRNAQFELRIASYFCQREYRVNLATDCDVVADLGTYRYFVECKRVASKSQLKRRIRAAKKQLHSRMDRGKNTFGIVAADVTKVAYSHNGLTFGVSSQHSRDVIRNDLQKVSQALDEGDFSSRLILIWLQIHIANLVLNPSQTSSRFSSLFELNPKQRLRMRKSLKNLKPVLEVGDEPDPLAIPGKPIKFREKVVLPQGSMWGWKDELIEAYIDGAKIPVLREDETVLRLKVENQEHEFSYADFVNATSSMPESFRDALPSDGVAAQCEIACLLYGNRFPLVVEDD